MAEFNGIEINDEMLEGIAGGALDEDSINNLKGIVTLFKMSGMSLEQVYQNLAYLQRSKDWDEIDALITKFYEEA